MFTDISGLSASNLNKAICASMVEELCTGAESKAGVEELLDKVWDLTQAREAWSLEKDSQATQSKLLGMIEKQDKELASAELERERQARLYKLNKIFEYWNRRRLEAVRGGIYPS